MAQWYLRHRTVDAHTKETSASANYTAEIEVDQAHIDKGSLCHTETSFKLESPRTTQDNKTEKNLKDNDRE
jgi:hypothetical protein